MRIGFCRPSLEDMDAPNWPSEPVDLAVLPELRAAAGLPSDSDVHARLRDRCKTNRQALLFGYAEACSGEIFNAAQMIDDQGIALANYRCAHPHSSFGIGRWLTVWTFRQSRIAVLLADDLLAPEVWRGLALSDVALIVWLGAGHQTVEPVLQARAIENGVSVAGWNDEQVHAFDAHGQPIAADRDQTMTVIEFSGLSTAKIPVVRQPVLYKRLAAES